MAEGITLKRIIDMDEAAELTSSDYALVDSSTGGPKKFAIGEALGEIKDGLNDLPLKSGTLLNNSNKFVAPYNDFNTFKQNECILITTNPTNYVNNVPNGFTSGWVITFNYKNVTTGGLAQIVLYATSTQKGRIAWRKKWGSTWDTWYYFDNTVDLTNTLNASISAVSQDANSKLVLRGYNEVTNASHLNLTDANNAEVNRVYSIQASNIVSNLPSDATTGGTLVTLNYKDTAAGKIQLLINNSTKTMYYRIYWSSWSDWFSCATKDYVESAISAIQDGLPNLYAAFQTIGVIGDSLASGECYDSEGHGTDLYDVSWIQFMCRAEGMTGYNFSRGGLTTKTWITDAKGYALASESDKKCKAYIIGLGQNDANVSMTIGSINDINDSDYTQNADSYYGNYGGIIQRMKVIQPDAKFFLITDPLGANSTTRAQYNVAVRTISQHFTNCYLIDLEQDDAQTYLDSNSYIYKNKVNGHYTAPAYRYMADIIARHINNIMYNNPNDFKFVQFIGS